MKTEIMKRAWEIAKEANEEFGGGCKVYFAESLKQAWAEVKERDNQERIAIDNEITLNTLKKIVRESWFTMRIENAGVYGQPSENLSNYFIGKKALIVMLNSVFDQKSNGSFPNSTKSMFGNRAKCRFVKSKLEELLG